MASVTTRRLRLTLGGGFAALAAGFCLFDAWVLRGGMVGQWPVWLALAVPAIVAAALSALRGRTPPVRLALGYLLAALVLLPRPGVLLMTLLILCAGRGAGVVGPRRASAFRFAAVIFVVSLTALLVGDAVAVSQGLLLRLGLLFMAVQAGTWLVIRMLEGRALNEVLAREYRPLLIETLNLPFALVLVGLLDSRAWAAYAVVSALVPLAGHLGRTRHQALRDLRLTSVALAARATELATLHSIGLEIVSSPETSRVFGVIDRECRKVLEVDFFFIALSDPDTSQLRAVYRSRKGDPAHTEPLTLMRGVASWVAARKRGVRIDDFDNPRESQPPACELVAEGMRSALVVPLIVGDDVIGVLSTQCLQPNAYDDHQLVVLTTIAQQAAVAIEGARNHEKATLDSLTGMFARDYFFRRLAEEYRRVRRYGGRFALLMVDLDGFKGINDRSGHIAGDRYLRGVGQVILRVLRAADLASRYGGDEFCLLLPETDLPGARAIAERLRHAVAHMSVRVAGRPVRTTVSIGIATFPEHDSGSLNVLLRKADEALYRAKRLGRDRVVPYAA